MDRRSRQDARESGEARLSRWLRSVEERPGGPWGWFVLLFGWILARDLLEGILERPGQMGFDWREEVSFPMYFLHFPLFYLSLFALLCLWIRLLSGRPMARVVRAVSLGYGVLLVAPVVDALASHGRGYDLKYLLGLGSFLWRFWNPAAWLGEVSPGQRIEILLAVLGGGLYTWAARRIDGARVTVNARAPDRTHGPARAIAVPVLAALGIYLLTAFLGAWPSFFARITLPSSPTAADAYRAAFQGGGLIPGESRRLAAVVAIPFLAALPFLLRSWAAGPFSARVRHAGWTRALYYTGLVPAGSYLGFLVYRRFLPAAYTNPTDFAATGVLWAAMLAAYLASLCWNDLHDRAADRINAPSRPLVSGMISEEEAGRAAAGAAVLSVYLALCVSYQAGLLLIACLFLSWAYSAPPLRLKRRPGIATAALAALSLLSAWIGFSIFGQEMTPRVFPGRVAAVLLAGVTLGFCAKDLKDAPGDRATGVVTIATLLGEPRARIAAACLVAIGYLLAPVFLPLGPGFWIAAAVFALTGALLTLRLRRPDGALLLTLGLFALLALALLTRNPRPLLEREEIVREHAALLRIEDAIRRRAPAPESTTVVLAGMVAQSSPVPHAIPERSAVAYGRVAEPAAGVPVIERLLAARPLLPSLWDELFRAASRIGGAPAGVPAKGGTAPVRAPADTVCTRAVALGIRPGDFLRNRAAVRLASGDSSGVAADLEGALLFGGRPALTRVLLGDYRMRAGRIREARAAYQAALRSDPDLPEAWAGLGEALYATRAAGAVDAFEKARALEPDDPWIWNNLGVALRDENRLDEAEAAFREAHHLAPGLFEPVYNLGVTSERLGLLQEAREWYERALRLRPGFAPAEQGRLRTAARPGP